MIFDHDPTGPLTDAERAVNDCCTAWYDYTRMLAQPDGYGMNAAIRDRAYDKADRRRKELIERLTMAVR